MAGAEVSMRVTWVVNDDYDPDTTIGSHRMKEIGSIWGTSKSWRKCSTDNVVCVEPTVAADLVKRAFQAVCNLYVPSTIFADIGRPKGVKVFEGALESGTARKSLVAALNLTAPLSDTVLLAGFQIGEPQTDADRLFLSSLKKVISKYSTVQWVALDTTDSPAAVLSGLPNLWFDTSENVIALLAQ